MEGILQFIANHSIGLVFGILVFFGLIETIFGYFANSKRTKDDVLIETVNTFFLFVITKPAVTFAGYYLMSVLLPATKDIISHWSMLTMTIVFMLGDDFLQYWYHRMGHEVKVIRHTYISGKDN